MKRLLAVFLVLTLGVTLFSGCAMLGLSGLLGAIREDLLPTEAHVTPPELPEPTEPTIPPTTEPVNPNDAPLRYAHLGSRDYAPEDEIVPVVDFADMDYERPDVEGLCDEFDALTALVERGADADTILEAYYAATDSMLHFYTMKNLAYTRYTLDTNDSYFKEENDALELLEPDVQEKLEAFYKACAKSPSQAELERKYFEAGFFDEFEDYSRYTNATYLSLVKEEEQLLSEYRTVLEDPQIEYKGQTQSYWELMSQYEEIETYKQYMEYLAIVQAYYEQFNQKVGEIFIRLVRVRKQIAQTMGYDSYADYAFDMVYERDYSHEQGRQFCDAVQKVLAPIYKQLINSNAYQQLEHFPIDDAVLTAGLQTAARNIGGEVEDAFRFMTAYHLCDLRSLDEKFDSSYTIYLYDYEAPFLTINAQGSSRDYVTFSHEFGHFVDAFVTYDAEEDLETAETFSQAMEFLSLCYTDGVFTDEERQMLIQLNLCDMMDTIVYQSALAEFEDGVYALDEDKLTVDSINDIYCQCCKDYGLYSSGLDFYYRYGWIDVTHFFESPYYVISYSVSADTALQVYLQEAEQPGEGLAAYRRLLEREPGEGVQSVMETAGLENPFRESAMEELAEFYKETFGLR